MSDTEPQAAGAAPEPAKPRIANCTGCGSHFEQLGDEALCPQCVKWAGIGAELAALKRVARR
jgi:hypothetical protein